MHATAMMCHAFIGEVFDQGILKSWCQWKNRGVRDLQLAPCDLCDLHYLYKSPELQTYGMLLTRLVSGLKVKWQEGGDKKKGRSRDSDQLRIARNSANSAKSEHSWKGFGQVETEFWMFQYAGSFSIQEVDCKIFHVLGRRLKHTTNMQAIIP